MDKTFYQIVWQSAGETIPDTFIFNNEKEARTYASLELFGETFDDLPAYTIKKLELI